MALLWNFSGPRLVGGDFNSWLGEYWTITMKTQHTDTWYDITANQDLGYTVDQTVRFDHNLSSV